MVFCCQRAVSAHQNAPGVPDREPDIVVFGNIYRIQQQTKINEAPVQMLRDKGCIAAVNVIMDQWIVLLQTLCRPGEKGDAIGLPTSNVYFSIDILVGGAYLFFGFFKKFDQFLCSFLQKHAVFRQSDPFTATDKKLFPSSSSSSFNCRERGGWVIFKVCAARVILPSLATARKYCKTRISIGCLLFLKYILSLIVTNLFSPFKYGLTCIIAICHLRDVFV